MTDVKRDAVFVVAVLRHHVSELTNSDAIQDGGMK